MTYRTVEITPTLKAVEGADPFGGEESWWTLYVQGPRGRWVSVQSGSSRSSLWYDLGVSLPQ